MALGDKSYSYNYYNVPVDRKWTNGLNEPAFAALVRPNIWGYQPDGIYYDDGMYSNADKNGKPLDDTIAVWYLPRNASYACNAMFSVDTSSTLNAHYDVNIENNDVPLAVGAIDVTSLSYGTFGRRPWYRYAHGISTACNGPYSVLAYDIKPNALCIFPDVYIYNRNSKTQTTIVLNNIANAIGNNDKIDLMFIRPRMYHGDIDERIMDAVTIPSYPDQPPYFQGVPIADTLTDKPIASGQTYLKSLIADTAGGHDYPSDSVYAPFYTQYQQVISDSNGTNSYSFQMQIGFVRQLTKNNIVNGYASLGGGNRITAQFYRCNYDAKSFEDVSYQWENVIFDETNGIEIHNGADLTNYDSADNFRFYTRIKIINAKGNSRGKALELAVKHELAYIGFYFADTQAGAESAVLGSNGDGVGVYLPEKIGGVTTGRYFTGDEIKNVPYADADSASAFPYEPEMTGADSGDLETHLHSDTISGSAQWYALSELDMYFLSQWLNTTYKPDQTQFTEDFKGVNPSDYIISVKYYPFDVPASVTTEALSVGGVAVEVNNVGISPALHDREYGTGTNSYFDLGSFTIAPPYIYGDFRDTYMKLLVYIPWCGFTTIDNALFMQSPNGAYHTIRCALSIDFATGAALGMIYRDDTLIECVNGTVGVDIPLSAIANGTYQNAIKQTEIALKNAKTQQISAALSMAGAVAGGVVSAATGNVVGLGAAATAFVSGAVKNEQLNTNIENLQYQLSHTAPAVGDVSSASPFNGALSDQTAKIYIFRASMLPGFDKGEYAKTTGHACCKQGILSQISSGYTECAGADLSGINCTATEKSMIFAALKSGVII